MDGNEDKLRGDEKKCMLDEKMDVKRMKIWIEGEKMDVR